MALYQFNGKTASFLFLNGRVIKNWMPLKMSYTIEDHRELHTFNPEFNYEMEVYENDSGTYTVNIYSEDDFTLFNCNKNTISIEYLELTSNVTDMSRMFYNCKSLTSLDLSNFNTSNVTSMNYMFYNCKSLTSLDLSNFNTSNVTNMSRMFYYCESLTSLDLSNFNTSNVTNMYRMFNGCISLTSLDVSNFDTSNVTDMRSMFQHCSSLTSLDLSNFDTNNVTGMGDMFNSCTSLTSLDLSNFDISNVTDMSNMFYSCVSLNSLDVSNFDTSKVTNMSNMFYHVPTTVDWQYDGYNYQNWSLTEEQIGFSGTFPWNITYTVTVNYIDDNNKKIIDPYIITVKNKQKYDIELETNRTFKGYAHLEVQGELTGVATGNVIINDLYENFNYVEYKIDNSSSSHSMNRKGTHSDNPDKEFYYYLPQPDESSNGWRYALLTLSDGTTTTDLSTPVHKVERVRVYFYNNTTYFRFNCIHSKITEIIYMYTENFTTFEDMFKGNMHIKKVDLTGWKTENVTSMKNMFHSCGYELSQVVGLEGLDVKNLTDTSYMFYNCDELTGSLNFSWTNTDKVRNAERMFYGCKSLTSLDLSNFDTSNVTNMSYMFDYCESLTSLDLSNFDTSNVTNMSYMFYCCKSLTSLDLSNFDTSNVTSKSLMFSSVPVTVDWHYDGTNYTNWTLTETGTGFSGTFPWNK